MDLSYFEWNSSMGAIPTDGKLVITDFPFDRINGINSNFNNIRFYTDSAKTNALPHYLYNKNGIRLLIISFPSGFSGNRLYHGIIGSTYNGALSGTYRLWDLKAQNNLPSLLSMTLTGSNIQGNLTSLSNNYLRVNRDTSKVNGGMLCLKGVADSQGQGSTANAYTWSKYIVVKRNTLNSNANAEILPAMDDNIVARWGYTKQANTMCFLRMGANGKIGFYQRTGTSSTGNTIHEFVNPFVDYSVNKFYLMNFSYKNNGGTNYLAEAYFDLGGISQRKYTSKYNIAQSTLQGKPHICLNAYNTDNSSSKGGSGLEISFLLIIPKYLERIASEYNISYVWGNTNAELVTEFNSKKAQYTTLRGDIMYALSEGIEGKVYEHANGIISKSQLEGYYSQVRSDINDLTRLYSYLKDLYDYLQPLGLIAETLQELPELIIPEYNLIDYVNPEISEWLTPKHIFENNNDLEFFDPEIINYIINVKDISNNPINEASVTINDLTKLTNESGNVDFNLIKGKNYEVKVERSLFKTRTVVLIPDDLEELPIILEREIHPAVDYILGLDSLDCNLSTPSWEDKTGNRSMSFTNPAGLIKDADGGLRFLGNTTNCIINTNMPQSTLNSTDFTIELMVKFDSDGMNQYRGILGWAYGSNGVEIGAFSGSNYNIIMGSPALTVSSSLLTPNSYIHQVITRSGTTVKCYLNGVLVASGNPTLNFNYNNFILGRSYDHEDAYPRRFKGVIRHLNIFNRALSDTEINTNCEYYLEE